MAFGDYLLSTSNLLKLGYHTLIVDPSCLWVIKAEVTAAMARMLDVKTVRVDTTFSPGG